MRAPAAGGQPLYREIEHTADVGIAVEAADPAACFEKAALALGALMVDLERVALREARPLRVTAKDWPELMHAWLSEVLALCATDGFVAAEVVIAEIDRTHVAGLLRGERYDPTRHDFHGEIKAVTYHGLTVQPEGDVWQARVIFDV